MKTFFNYLFFSSNKPVYTELAKKYKMNAWRVYRLAHGKKAVSQDEKKVLDELHKLKIISGYKYW